MTYKEYFLQLRQEFAVKTDIFIKAEEKLTEVNGFFDKVLWDNYVNAKNEWQEAANSYHSFAYMLNTIPINIDDEMFNQG